MRPFRALLVAVVVTALVAGCAAVAPPSDVSGPDSGAWGITLTDDELTGAGIVIVEDEDDVVDDSASSQLTKVQAERIVAEAALGAGLTGEQLDAAVPVAAPAPPMSYVLAAYLSADDLPGDLRGRALLRGAYPQGTDWTHPQQLVFPTAVLALFVQDMMTAALADDSFEQSDVTGGGAGGAGASVLPAMSTSAGEADAGASVARSLDAPCSTVQGFIQRTIQSLFDVLRIIPAAVTKISELGTFGVILAAVLDTAIGLAQGVVEGLVATITAPVLDAIRVALGGLGTATLVLSYFTDERLVVTAAPADHTAFSIDPAPGVTGTFTAAARSLTKDWPAALVDCAKASGAEIPPLLRAGDPAEWRITVGDRLIALDSASAAISADKTGVMGYTTGHEDAETAEGPEVTEIARVAVKVPRKEVGDFFDLAARQVENAKGDILAKVPELFRGAAKTVLDAAIDPIVASMRASLEGPAGGIGILTLQGDGFVWVTHHEPKEPTPTPSASADPESDDGLFCRQFDDQVAIAIAALDATDDLFAWAAGFATGLRSITATPPAELAGDFATVVGFYDVSGASDISDTGRIADYVGSHDVDGARQRLWSACGAPAVDIS